MIVQGIITKYLGPTDKRQSRIKGNSLAGSVIVNYDGSLNIERNHARAAEALANKFEWRGSWFQGGDPNQGYCFVNCADEPAFVTTGKGGAIMTPTLPQSAGWHGDPRRGAALGRTDKLARFPNITRKFYLRRIRLDAGGYDSGGAYWGLGPRLYWAVCDSPGGADSAIEFFFRARNRDAAKAEVVTRHPAARFFR